MTRADVLIFKKGLSKSRENSKKLIEEGAVFCGGKKILKPSELLDDDAELTLTESVSNRFVSRGGLKLEFALEHFNIDVNGATALDIGASTGGFTDCLLSRGARTVYAVDAGAGQLDPKLRGDPRVVAIEKCNARYPIDGVDIPCDIVVMDVSFISQTLLYDTVCSHLKADGAFISLVKPQFEVGRENIGSGGIVRSEKARRLALDKVFASAAAHGFIKCGCVDSPIAGGDGNAEYLALFRRRSDS